jgi:type IV pilus biogenesis protein CpaD/CtpE
MSKPLLRIFLALVVCALAGCAGRDKQPKSSAHVYEGDAPTIHYSNEREAAGGPLNPY